MHLSSKCAQSNKAEDTAFINCTRPMSSSLKYLWQYPSHKWCSVCPMSSHLCSKHTFYGGEIVMPFHILPQFQHSNSHLKVVLLIRLKTHCHLLEAYPPNRHSDISTGRFWRLSDFSDRMQWVPPYWRVFQVPSLLGSLLIYPVHEGACVFIRLCIPYQEIQEGGGGGGTRCYFKML